MGRRFETDRAHLNLSVEIAFLIINCHLGHSSVTYLSLLRLKRGQDPAYRATLLLIGCRTLIMTQMANLVSEYLRQTACRHRFHQALAG